MFISGYANTENVFYCLNVNNSLQAKRREDLEADDLEVLWLEVCPYKSRRPLFIGGVYRPPSSRVANDKRLGENIENVHLLNKETILLGDINIDFLCTIKFQKHPFTKTLQNLNMSKLVMEITRQKITRPNPAWITSGVVTLSG